MHLDEDDLAGHLRNATLMRHAMEEVVQNVGAQLGHRPNEADLQQADHEFEVDVVNLRFQRAGAPPLPTTAPAPTLGLDRAARNWWEDAEHIAHGALPGVPDFDDRDDWDFDHFRRERWVEQHGLELNANDADRLGGAGLDGPEPLALAKAMVEHLTSRAARRAAHAVIPTIEQYTKICPGPKCRARIQRVEGCNSMICEACRTQFCWQCLRSDCPVVRTHGACPLSCEETAAVVSELEQQARDQDEQQAVAGLAQVLPMIMFRMLASIANMNFAHQGGNAIARDVARDERAGRAAANLDECCRRFRSQRRVSGIV